MKTLSLTVALLPLLAPTLATYSVSLFSGTESCVPSQAATGWSTSTVDKALDCQSLESIKQLSGNFLGEITSINARKSADDGSDTLVYLFEDDSCGGKIVFNVDECEDVSTVNWGSVGIRQRVVERRLGVGKRFVA